MREAVANQKLELGLMRVENKDLRSNVDPLELRVEDSEKYSRRHSVQVYGVPEAENENILQTVVQLCNVLNINRSSSRTC